MTSDSKKLLLLQYERRGVRDQRDRYRPEAHRQKVKSQLTLESQLQCPTYNVFNACSLQVPRWKPLRIGCEDIASVYRVGIEYFEYWSQPAISELFLWERPWLRIFTVTKCTRRLKPASVSVKGPTTFACVIRSGGRTRDLRKETNPS